MSSNGQTWRRAATRLWATAATAVVVLGVSPPAAEAQLDPLLFLQRTKPNIIIAVDVANRMQRDADETYYDPFAYTRTGAAWEAVIGVSAETANARYRRRYIGLEHLDNFGDDKFRTSSISPIGDREAGWSSFEARTRLGVARLGLLAAIQRNTRVARFGLVKMRQHNPRMGTEKNEGPVWSVDPQQEGPTETGAFARWKITRPVVDSNNGAVGALAPVVKADAASANADVAAVLGRAPDQAGALVPAGRDGRVVVDAPVERMLADVRTEAARLIAADTHGRNTVAILVVGGGQGTTDAGVPETTAASFLNVSGRRVPIYVIAILPPPDSVASLRAVATNSGGGYYEITREMIEAAPAGTAVPEVIRAANAAIQHAFAAQADVDATPTPQLPLGPLTESQTTGPVVGTVNLEDARDITGAALEHTRIVTPAGTVIPQRSNLLVTAGFSLPGFEGRLRAFRLYKPEPDATKPYGWAFVSAGTRLWVASAPAEPTRNLFTAMPDGEMVALSVANADRLAPYLGASDPRAVIAAVRQQPLGAVVGSTPAVLDPPSLDPPPDGDYPQFAANLIDRRSIIFVGANDGMLHAIDARTGVEVWAFVPFNLLPKLKALGEGQAVGSFTYFVDSSPKIADVKVDGRWRTYLILGEGPGGTFYQTLDVTLDSLPAAVPSRSDDVSALLSYFAQPSRVPFVWSFPSYASFDPGLAPWGDVRANAPAIEKTVGETWSDPAVGQVESDDSEYVVLVGSGFLAHARQQQANRAGVVAGTTFYVLSAATGAVLDSRDVGSDGVAETVDNCAVVNDCRRSKNALQADPVATGPTDSRYITKAYIGDLDGRVWRFDLGLNASRTARVSGAPRLLFDATNVHPIFASMASVNVGGTQDYLFFGSGSDLLPSAGVSQAYKLFGVLDSNGVGLKKFDIALEAVDGQAGDEKVSAFPAVAGDIVFFTTTTYWPAAPVTPPTANLYAVTFIGGAAYDGNGDMRLTSKDLPKLRSVPAGRATAPFAVDQHLVFAAGNKVEILGDPRDYNNGVGQMGVRILSWRERR